MSDAELRNRIAQLEELVRLKDAEVFRYRNELMNAARILEEMTLDVQKDLKIAAAIQKILSPTELPHIPGVDISSKFIAGSDRGGDYFDLFEHEDKLKFGLIVTCSSGYAMSALFLSVLIQMSSKIEAKKGLPPDVVLKQMASEIVAKIHEKDSADVFYGIMDRRNYEFSYALSGSLCAFYHDQESTEWTRLEPSTGPFCKGFDAEPLKESLLMGPKDRILICTRGVVQATAKSGDFFGLDRIKSILNSAPKTGVHELRNEVLYQVQQFTGLTEPFADQTILVLEVKDRVLKLAKK